jgi:anti-sigma regulatory factor (Ser/Thr protein kinase)
MTPPRVSATLANRLEEIERLAGIVEAFGAQHGLPAAVLFQLNVALDEILTNVISYGYEDDGAHQVVVRMALDGDWLRVEVEDDGRPFDPLQVPEPDLAAGIDRPGNGGLGMHFVRSMMDEVAYRREDARNIFSMAKRHRPGSAAPAEGA